MFYKLKVTQQLTNITVQIELNADEEEFSLLKIKVAHEMWQHRRLQVRVPMVKFNVAVCLCATVKQGCQVHNVACE